MESFWCLMFHFAWNTRTFSWLWVSWRCERRPCKHSTSCAWLNRKVCKTEISTCHFEKFVLVRKFTTQMEQKIRFSKVTGDSWDHFTAQTGETSFETSKRWNFIRTQKKVCWDWDQRKNVPSRGWIKNHENYSTGLIAEKYWSEDEQKTSESYSSERYRKLSSSWLKFFAWFAQPVLYAFVSKKKVINVIESRRNFNWLNKKF